MSQNLGSVRKLISAYDKDMWIAATGDYVNFHLVVLFSLTAILRRINFTASLL